MADRRSVGVTQLVRMWVQERMAADEGVPDSLAEALNQIDTGVDRVRDLLAVAAKAR